MGKLCAFSLEHEDVLFKTFGVNAELLIDHAWGMSLVRWKISRHISQKRIVLVRDKSYLVGMKRKG